MTMASTDSHYDTLGVSHDATTKEIKAAYRELAKSLHPDKNKFGAALFKRINEAHAVLSDPVTRKAYDRNPKTPQPRPSPEKSDNNKENDDKGEKTPQPRPSPEKCDNNKQNDDKGEENKMLQQKLTCTICNETVGKCFFETLCCGRLCCTSCKEKQQRQQPNSIGRCPLECEASRSVDWLRRGWQKPSKAFCNFLDHVAPSCLCGMRLLLGEHEKKKHELVCPLLNTLCFKCSGSGSCFDLQRHMIQCNSCLGRKFLPGRDWMKCFKCKGRGAFNTVANKVVNCTTCETKGGLRGPWTICFKCQGHGAYDTNRGYRISCETCMSKGAFKGFNLKECGQCRGCGCQLCNYTGAEPCSCGLSCKGHKNQSSLRSKYRRSRYLYDDCDEEFDSDSW